MIGRIFGKQITMGKANQTGLNNRWLTGLVAFVATSTSVTMLPAAYADDAPMPIKRISVNPEQQLVIEFATPEGSFPAKPNVQDFPGTNHRLVLDFKDSIIDKEQIAPAKDTLGVLTKAYPAIKGLRYAALTNTATPTARIVLDLPETLKTNPHIVKLEANSVTIDLGFEGGSEKIAADTPTTPEATPSTSSTSVASSEPSRERIEAPTTLGTDTDKPTLPATTPTPTATPAPAAADIKPDTTATNAAGDLSTPSTPEASKGTDSTLTGTTPKSANEILSNPSSTTALQIPAATTEQKPASLDLPQASGGAGSDTTSASVPSTTSKEDAPIAGLTKDGSEKPGDQVASITPVSATTAPSPSTAAPVSVTPSGDDAKHQYAEAVRHYNQGYEMHKSNKLTAAIAEYKLAIEANPNLSQAYSNLGMIYNQQHNYSEALTQFRKALAIDPKDAITYNGIGAALRAQKDLPGAIKNWQSAVSLDPKLATAHYNLGTAYEIQKDYDKALECYRQAVKNDYRLGEAYYRMGLILQKRNNLEEALEQFNKALKVSTKAEYSQDAHQRIALLNERKSTKK